MKDFTENNFSVIGLDLGGTKLLAGEADGQGNILREKKYVSGFLDQDAALSLLQTSLCDYFAALPKGAKRPAALGLAMVGRVNNKEGIWYEIDPGRSKKIEVCRILAALCAERWAMPCFAENDVRAACKAERVFGHGRETNDFIYLNIGTGIAAGFVSGGNVHCGGNCNGGEVGHTLVGIDAGLDLPCECGRVNCVEAVASGSGIDRAARALRARYPGTSLEIPEAGRVSVREVFEKAASDPLCAFLADTAARAIANLIMNLVRTTDPEMVVLGGGLVSDGFLFPKILENLNKNTMRFVTKGVRLTALSPSKAGLLGACAVAIEGMRGM